MKKALLERRAKAGKRFLSRPRERNNMNITIHIDGIDPVGGFR